MNNPTSIEQLKQVIQTLKVHEVIEIKRDRDNPDRVTITIKSTHRQTIDLPRQRGL